MSKAAASASEGATGREPSLAPTCPNRGEDSRWCLAPVPLKSRVPVAASRRAQRFLSVDSVGCTLESEQVEISCAQRQGQLVDRDEGPRIRQHRADRGCDHPAGG